jgi:hypothetical protein
MFNNDESRILTWSDDGIARLWAVGICAPLQIFQHGKAFNEATFNLDASRILAWGEDGKPEVR